MRVLHGEGEHLVPVRLVGIFHGEPVDLIEVDRTKGADDGDDGPDPKFRFKIVCFSKRFTSDAVAPGTRGAERLGAKAREKGVQPRRRDYARGDPDLEHVQRC